MSGNSYISHKHKLVIFWSPKCACTAVVDWFFNIQGFDDRPQKRNWLAESGYLYSYKQAMHLVNDLEYKSVQFTRDPYGRAVSAYLNKFYIYQNKPLTEFKQLESFSQELVSAYNKKNDLPETVFSGFSFIEYLEFLKFWMSKRKVINHHWDTQLPRDLEIRIKPDFIVKQESFNSDLAQVNSVLEFDPYVPAKKNKTDSPPEFNNSEKLHADMNSMKLLEQKIFLRRKNLLSAQAKKLIAEIYSEDFEFFQYAK